MIWHLSDCDKYQQKYLWRIKSIGLPSDIMTSDLWKVRDGEYINWQLCSWFVNVIQTCWYIPYNPNCNCIRALCAASRCEKSSSAQFSADLLVRLTYPCHNHICRGPHRQCQHSRRRNHRHPHHHQWQQQQFTQHAAFYRLLGLLRQRAMCKKCFSLKSCFTILLSSRRRRWRRPRSPSYSPAYAGSIQHPGPDVVVVLQVCVHCHKPWWQCQ